MITFKPNTIELSRWTHHNLGSMWIVHEVRRTETGLSSVRQSHQLLSQCGDYVKRCLKEPDSAVTLVDPPGVQTMINNEADWAVALLRYGP